MSCKNLVIVGFLFGVTGLAMSGVIGTTDITYPVNDTSDEITQDQGEQLESPSILDSHEAMNNRELKMKLREKRSFEFLVGLINNNSKYEVLRSDPEAILDGGVTEIEENQTEATKLLLELLMKIVKYPNNWQKIHQMLKNLDDDLISSQHILNYHRHLEKQKPNHNTEYKRRINDRQNHIPQQTTGAPMHKWPTFDTNDGTTRGSIENGYTQKSVTEKQAYQKNFAYHKVTGKPAHLKKNPIAYIAVSAISPKPSDSEEDIMLETELHRLKPWRNKRTPQKV
ncbi:uncharacterized protein LOC143200523 isoform X2 [Rhynchophorus ferrugineus]|uniref:uncharacterized protein LOC143200523 isoform X2 n=1 Tax=Rhynchophorus ferrugineus TaxID=354439 RepID=UPI003FCCC54A